jgi:hypothetical protein
METTQNLLAESSDALQTNWLLLHSQNRLQDAFDLKRNWLENIIESKKNELTFSAILERIKAYIWLGMPYEAKALLSQIMISSLSKKEMHLLNIIEANIAILMNEIPQQNFIPQSFINYVKGKRIALIGPAIGEHSLEDAISKYDFVVRFNHTQEASLTESAHNPASTLSISYYSKQHFVKHLDVHMKMLQDSHIEYMIINGWNPSQGPADMASILMERTRAPSPFVLVYQAVLLATPRCLYDLLLCEPKSIHVYNSDFYTVYPFYRKNYFFYSDSKEQFFRSLGVHDLIFSFNFCKMLIKNKKVSGDAAFLRALNLSMEDYLKVIKENLDKLKFN